MRQPSEKATIPTGIGVVSSPSTRESPEDPPPRAVGTKRLFSLLQSISADVFIISSNDICEFANSNPSISVGFSKPDTPWSLMNYILIQILICKRIFDKKALLDVLYFHKGGMTLLVPILFAKVLDIKVCVVKGNASNTVYSGVSRFYTLPVLVLERLVIRYVDAIIVYSANQRTQINHNNVFVTYSNPVDIEEFTPKKPTEDRPIEIGYVGRLDAVKNIDTLAAALEQICSHNPSINARVIGDGAEAELFEDLFNECEQVELTGWVDPKNLPKEYQKMQTILFPSKSEGLPASLLEAMSSGVVPIAAPVGCIPDVVDDGENGFLIHNVNVESICELYTDEIPDANLSKMAENARETVVTSYSSEALRNDFITITERLSK